MSRRIDWSVKRKMQELLEATQGAIDSYISDIRRGVSAEAEGSARKNELQSIKEAFMNCKDLIVEYEKLEARLKEEHVRATDEEEIREFKPGFAEKYAKK
jgi:hypothetical protein